MVKQKRKLGTMAHTVHDFERLQSQIDSNLGALRRIISEWESCKNGETRRKRRDERGRKQKVQTSVLDFMQQQVNFLKDCKRLGTAQNYQRAHDSLKTFLGDKKLYFSDVTTRFADSYNDFLLQKGLLRNSISFYMRILRAVFNKAVRCGLAEQTYPFKEVYTGIDKTRKLAVNKDFMKHLIELQIPEDSPLMFARDLFLFSFYARGMAFVDIAFLKKTDLNGNVIRYTRHKTGQTLIIKIEPCIRSIIDKYATKVKNTPYVFPILKGSDLQENYRHYKNRLRVYNSHLKQLAMKIGTTVRLSSYTSRHTWASMARAHNIPLSVISAGMGHTSEKTTEIYLTSIENPIVDGANKELLDSLNSLFLNKR